jgi:hypothetical protein
VTAARLFETGDRVVSSVTGRAGVVKNYWDDAPIAVVLFDDAELTVCVEDSTLDDEPDHSAISGVCAVGRHDRCNGGPLYPTDDVLCVCSCHGARP